jgi:hypothetical protein
MTIQNSSVAGCKVELKMPPGFHIIQYPALPGILAILSSFLRWGGLENNSFDLLSH